MAANNLARYGTREHIPLLEKTMEDKAVLITIRENVVNVPVAQWPTHEVQIRDVALAVSILLSDQKLEDYGFVDHQKANKVPSNSSTYSYARYYLNEANPRLRSRSGKNGGPRKIREMAASKRMGITAAGPEFRVALRNFDVGINFPFCRLRFTF